MSAGLDPTSRRFPPQGWVALFCLLPLLVPGTSCRPRDGVAEGVRILRARQIQYPWKVLEVWFDQPIVPVAAVGVVATNPPLVISPPCPGEFVWASTRSGQFTPSEPWKLDTLYRVSLRSDLKLPNGKPCPARLQQSLRTPPLEVRTERHPIMLPNPRSESATLTVWFNADVDRAEVASHVSLLRQDGRRVAAEVEQATTRSAWPLPTGQPYPADHRTWKAAFAARQPGGNDPPEPHPGNVFVIRPKAELTGTKPWKLVFEAGLRAREERLKLPRPVEFGLKPWPRLQIVAVNADNALHLGRQIRVNFDRHLPRELTGTNVLAQIQITPPVSNLQAEVLGRRIVFSAPTAQGVSGFELRRLYTVTFPAGFPAEGDLRLATNVSKSVTFEPMAPRIFLPAYDADQMANGKRRFRLASLNVHDLWVRTKRLDRAHLVHALRGYAGYNEAKRLAPRKWSPHTELDFNLIPGVTVLDVHPKLDTAEDTTQVHGFAWEDMLGGKQHGAVFLDARDIEGDWQRQTRTGSQAILQLTDLGVLWKRGGEQLLVHVFSYTSGEPVPGARVELVTDEDVPLAEGQTDDAGLTWLAYAPDTADAWLVISKEDDVHALPAEGYDCDLYRSGVRQAWGSPREDSQRVLMFTDRGVYRPGDTLHLKIITRDTTAAELRNPAPAQRTLVLRNPKWDTILRTNLTFNERGSAALDLRLPTEPRGSYHLALGPSRWGSPSTSVIVADYRPNPFELSLLAPQELPPGKPLEVSLKARYLFGAPVSRGRVLWRADSRRAGFNPAGFENWKFSLNDWRLRELGFYDPEPSEEGEGLHTAATNLVISPRVAFHPEAPGPLAMVVRANLTDPGQQTVSAETRLIAHSSAYYIGRRQAREVFTTGEEAAFDLIAVTYDGKPWPRPVEAEVRFQEIRWHTVRLLGAGNRPQYRSEMFFTNRTEQAVIIQPLAKTNVFRQNLSQIAFKPPEPGQYLLEIEARDPDGRRVLHRSTFYVGGEGRLAWNYRDAPRLELLPDKPLYAPGETAYVLIKAPFTGRALVSVERGTVRRQFNLEVTGNAPVIRVPLTAADAPNVFVSATLLRGAEQSPYRVKMPDYRFGACELRVDPESHRLQVEVAPDAPVHQPADPVSVRVQVLDHAGQAAPDTEVTLFAVDEGVLTLDGYQPPDPLKSFYQSWPLQVQTSLSLFRLLTEDPAHWTYPNKGYIVGGGGRLSEPLRQNWEPCPLWIASLLTGPDGRAKAAFTAPDSLTRYRIFAVAHTEQQQFGLGTGRFEVRKPIMLQPALPMFARVGDHLTARAMLRNRSGQSRRVTVRLALDDTAEAENNGDAPIRSLSKTLDVADGAEAVVDFPVRLVAAGDARWIWEAAPETGGPELRGDRVESRLKISHATPRLREVIYSRLTDGATNLLAEVDPSLLEGGGTATIRIAESGSIHLGRAFRELLHYPYGCVEQTSSSLLPWVLVRQDPVLSRLLEVSEQEYAAAVAAGVKRLFSMQTSEGGLSYWPGGRTPQLWGSAYAGLVLALLHKTGADLPESDFNRLITFLRRRAFEVVQNKAESDDSHCLLALALATAGQCPPPYTRSLYAHRSHLGSEGRAWLTAAIALSTGVDERTSTLLGATEGPKAAHAPFGDDVRRLAVKLLARTLCEPEAAKTANLARQLRVEIASSAWHSTQANAWAAFALREFHDRNNPAGVEIRTGTLTWKADQIPLKLDADTPLLEQVFRLDQGDSNPQLELRHVGGGPLFVETEIISHARRPLLRPMDQGFSLTRSYQRLGPNGEPAPLDALRVGEPVLVRLELRADHPASYLAVVDPLPAVLEAVNLPSQQAARKPASAPLKDELRHLYPDFQEIRAEEVRFFVNYLGRGRYVVTYLARARCAGEVVAPSAKVEAMYDGTRRGLSGAAQLKCHGDL